MAMLPSGLVIEPMLIDEPMHGKSDLWDFSPYLELSASERWKLRRNVGLARKRASWRQYNQRKSVFNAAMKRGGIAEALALPRTIHKEGNQ